MAKVSIKSEKITPFGRIFHVRELFSRYIGPVIDKVLGLRCTSYGYQYSEIAVSLSCVFFCGIAILCFFHQYTIFVQEVFLCIPCQGFTRFFTVCAPQYFHKILWQDYIFHIDSIIKQGSNFAWRKCSYSITNFGDKKLVLGMLFGKLNEFIHVRLDGFHIALHHRDGITLSLQPYPLAPYRPKAIVNQTRSPSNMSSSCMFAASLRPSSGLGYTSKNQPVAPKALSPNPPIPRTYSTLYFLLPLWTSVPFGKTLILFSIFLCLICNWYCFH